MERVRPVVYRCNVIGLLYLTREFLCATYSNLFPTPNIPSWTSFYTNFPFNEDSRPIKEVGFYQKPSGA